MELMRFALVCMSMLLTSQALRAAQGESNERLTIEQLEKGNAAKLALLSSGMDEYKKLCATSLVLDAGRKRVRAAKRFLLEILEESTSESGESEHSMSTREMFEARQALVGYRDMVRRLLADQGIESRLEKET
jgi:hypothetical protein